MEIGLHENTNKQPYDDSLLVFISALSYELKESYGIPFDSGEAVLGFIAERVQEEFGGTRPYIKSFRSVLRKRVLNSYRKTSLPIKQIATLHEISERTVYNIINKR